MKTTLLASAPTLEGIKKCISEYWWGTRIAIKKVNEKIYDVYNEKGRAMEYRVILKRGRYRFERI